MLRRLAKFSAFRFALVGGVGFLVDAGVLTLVFDALGPYWGRAVSFFCGALTTWFLNRRYTFADRHSGLQTGREFGNYLGAMLAGGAINFGVYALLVGFAPFFAAWPVLAVAAGSLSGMAVNFTLARYLVFAHGR
jgi:putative flippase GtrA